MKDYTVYVYNYTKHIRAGYRKNGQYHTYVRGYTTMHDDMKEHECVTLHISAFTRREAINKAVEIRRKELESLKNSSPPESSSKVDEKVSHAV